MLVPFQLLLPFQLSSFFLYFPKAIRVVSVTSHPVTCLGPSVNRDGEGKMVKDMSRGGIPLSPESALHSKPGGLGGPTLYLKSDPPPNTKQLNQTPQNPKQYPPRAGTKSAPKQGQPKTFPLPVTCAPATQKKN